MSKEKLDTKNGKIGELAGIIVGGTPAAPVIKHPGVKKLGKLKRKKRTGNKGGAPLGNKNAVGADNGAPTKFKPEYAEAIIKFFSVEPSRKEVMNVSKGFSAKGAQNFEKTEAKMIPNKLPTMTGFAESIQVDRTTILNWAELGQQKNEDGTDKNPAYIDFFHAYTRAKGLYTDFITQNGLAGLYPPQFAIFIAKNTTEYRDDERQPIVQNFILEGVKIVRKTISTPGHVVAPPDDSRS